MDTHINNGVPVCSDKAVSVTVQGPRPDNILFQVHEVIEGIIRESFHGVEYQYLVPCPDCLKEAVRTSEM